MIEEDRRGVLGVGVVDEDRGGFGGWLCFNLGVIIIHSVFVVITSFFVVIILDMIFVKGGRERGVIN
jgi:hypothetical protein